MKNDPTDSTSDVKHRLVVPIQTRGNIGKSTEAVARCEWMSQRGIAWAGYDLDQFNRTLSTTFPDVVQFLEPGQEPESEIINVLRRIAKNEVTVIDPSAHMERTILEALRKVKFAEIAAAAQARLTVVIFPIDEISDMDDIASTVETLGKNADWVVVRNPTKIRTTKFFDGSELETALRGLGAAFLEIPLLLAGTRNHLRAWEIRIGRGLSPAEALKNADLKIDLMHRMILESWLQDMFRAFDAIASRLLPTQRALGIQAKQAAVPLTRSKSKRGAAVNLENIS